MIFKRQQNLKTLFKKYFSFLEWYNLSLFQAALEIHF